MLKHQFLFFSSNSIYINSFYRDVGMKKKKNVGALVAGKYFLFGRVTGTTTTTSTTNSTTSIKRKKFWNRRRVYVCFIYVYTKTFSVKLLKFITFDIYDGESRRRASGRFWIEG